MSDVWMNLVVRVVRAWTRLYTAGLPAEWRDRRRAEIESDLWEAGHDATRASRAGQMLLRSMFGVGDDLAWRQSCQERSWIVWAAAVSAIAATVIAATLLVVSRASLGALPAPAPVVLRARPLPPPPPPPPPPCVPSGVGQSSPSPCTR